VSVPFLEDEGMKSTLQARRLAMAIALLGVVFSPRAASAQSELDASEAQAFLGTWTVSMETDFGGLEVEMKIEDQGGKVAASVGAPDPSTGTTITTEITDIKRSGEDLVLAYELDAQGQLMPVSMTLTPDGESLIAVFDVGGGLFSASGSATRAGN
jgi:hypothetical protein